MNGELFFFSELSNWIHQASNLWWEWNRLSLPGMIVLYLLAELVIYFGKKLPTRLCKE